MKRLTAILAAALIALSVSLPVLAEPEEQSGEQTSTVQSSQEESAQNSAAGSESKRESKSESRSESGDPASIEYTGHRIEGIGMSIDIPTDMYVITPGMDDDDPTLKACKLTKKEVEDSFSQSNTQLRAYAKDFSYDITVQVIENDRTKAIDNLTTLADAEVENVINSLISSEYASGCSKTVYNNILYLTLDKKYSAGDSDV